MTSKMSKMKEVSMRKKVFWSGVCQKNVFNVIGRIARTSTLELRSAEYRCMINNKF